MAKKDDHYWKDWEEGLHFSKLAVIEVYLYRARMKIDQKNYAKANSLISAAWYRLIDLEKSIKRLLKKAEKLKDADARLRQLDGIRDMLRTRQHCMAEQHISDDE